MAEKRVKVGKEFEHIPAVKSGRGWLGLEKGKTASVRFSKTYKKLQLIEKLTGGKERRTLYPVEEYAKANETARNANRIGEQAGTGFGTLRKEEQAALKIWREYVDEQQIAGTPAPNLADEIRALIERLRTKDETPPFPVVAAEFLDNKDKTRTLTLDYRTRIKNRIKTLSKAFAGARMGDITVDRLNETISKIARPASGEAPAEKTRKHWQALVKEIFEWFYKRENATRRPADKLANPLESLELQKITNKKDPETLTVSQVRALLSDLWENDRRALPATVVQLFCGLRNAEALRIRWRDIRDGEIILSRNYTKTRIARSVPIPPAAHAWLAALKSEGYPTPADSLLYPKNDTPLQELNALPPPQRKQKDETNFALRQKKFAGAMKRACERVGISKPENAFRHTAVSIMCKIYGFERAADYCGHSIKQQGDAYRNAVSAQDAKTYFEIMPPKSGNPAIVFDLSRKSSVGIPPEEQQSKLKRA